MISRKIYLISPREPSGATWLINCLLELGIKTYRNSNPSMWIKSGRHYQLSPHEDILKKWLPALWDHPVVSFRYDIEVEWSHVWPAPVVNDFQVIFFTRDPRDSLFSRYKRESPEQTFEEFIHFPDVDTLLDKAHNWRLFNLSWMAHPRQKVFRFEDYKDNDAEVLASVLDFIGLEYPPLAVKQALAASTFLRAAEAEGKYRLEHPDDCELINRAGKAGEWSQGGVPANAVSYIETICADAMQTLGYFCGEQSQQCRVDYSRLSNTLPFMQKISLPDWARYSNDGAKLLEPALEFARTVDYGQLARARLRPYEVAQLLDSLKTLARANSIKPLPDYKRLNRELGVPPGIGKNIRYFMDVLGKDLLKLMCKARADMGRLT